MMRLMVRTPISILMALSLAGCGASAGYGTPPAQGAATKPQAIAGDPGARPVDPAATDRPPPAGPWIGAAGASDFVLPGVNDTVLGIWVDVPQGSPRARANSAVALVIDTSGSMAGPKMEGARVAARAFVEKLGDGDIVSVHTFDDAAKEQIPPTVLTRAARASIYGILGGLEPRGATNLFDGLRLGENRVFAAPATHPIRRVVVLSDGIANVGPSTPEILGELAARGAESGVQVTALGLGLDYDERTLNALAIRSSGRLYHLAEPRDLSAMLEREISLLQATAATSASLEIVPAPGVQLLGAEAVRADWADGGSLRIPLGTMFGGQHREVLLRVRVTASAGETKPVASVRLHFRDPAEGNLLRVQEVVVRCQVTNDRLAVDQHANEKTRAIAATTEAAKVTLAAAQQLNQGQFADADKQLEVAEAKLKDSAARATSAADRKRAEAQAAQISSVRAATKKAAASPKPAPTEQRARALDANKAAMDAYGY